MSRYGWIWLSRGGSYLLGFAACTGWLACKKLQELSGTSAYFGGAELLQWEATAQLWQELHLVVA